MNNMSVGGGSPSSIIKPGKSDGNLALTGKLLKSATPKTQKKTFKAIENLIRKSGGGGLSKKDMMSLNALRLTLLGSTMDVGLSTGDEAGVKDVKREELTNVKDGPKERMLTKVLKEDIGVITACQCKSGQDRTGTEVALNVALDRFEAITGEVFDPLVDGDPTKNDQMRALFTEAADQFCADSNELCREPGTSLKAKKHPFFKAMYIKKTDERVSASKGHGLNIEPKSPLNIGSSLHHDNLGRVDVSKEYAAKIFDLNEGNVNYIDGDGITWVINELEPRLTEIW
ncbi:hypothetical protein DID80_04130 [Candidatus Marinamargulisbacteria bacterium SCGC AAA071-K20]|nr:hypothetical protein DID80_04130 [Candidatus Marinamargulisbacteria bacterium SCGC AAA071-K20]